MHRRTAADLILHCPFCQGLLVNDPALAGRLAFCPQCLNQFQMPGSSQVPVAQPASAESLARTLPAVIRQPLLMLPAPAAPPRVMAATAAVAPSETARSTPAPARPTPAPAPPTPPAGETAQARDWTPTLPVVERIAWREVGRPMEARPQERPQPTPPVAPTQTAMAPVPALAMPTAVPPVATPPAAATIAAPPIAAPPVAVSAPPSSEPLEPELLAVLPPPATGVCPAFETGLEVEAPGDCPLFFPEVTEETPGLEPASAFPRVDGSAEPVAELPADLAASLDEAAAAEEPAWTAHVPGVVTSAVTHAVLLIALAMWIIAQESPPDLDLLAVWSPTKHVELDTGKFEAKIEAPTEVDPAAIPAASPIEPEPVTTPAESFAVADLQAATDIREALPAQLPGGGAVKAAPYDSRGEGRRARMLNEGGTPESESAVAAGLIWLKEHQYPNGSWRFDHTGCPGCKGECDRPGREDSTTGATAMALLPFLGAGQTHQQGKYQEVVRKGLYYLVAQQEGRGDAAGDFRGEDGNMYCHGLAATALCEAYGMTRDKFLMVPAQKSLDFITNAQDKQGGGWRYEPGQRGDTSVVGWQIMALKSGHMAYLKVPKSTVTRANDYLTSVSSESGALYGYTSPGRGTQATTAIGLLCRMHLGWAKDHPGVVRGVQYLAEEGPSRNNMYYNYYATQVLHHFGGPHWKRWNEVMREQLINTQDKAGHERGSWGGRDHYIGSGGRLYVTSLSIMTLEVYYRHMPLYRDDAVKNEFHP